MYSYEYLKEFTTAIFLKIGCSNHDAEISAKILLSAELRGINSHGLIRLPDYIRLWREKRINAKPDIKILRETMGTAVMDGDAGLGTVVGEQAMLAAIAKAKNAGTGWISVRNSNHYGIAGYYAMMALEHDMIGIAMTNANPMVAPTFSTEKLLGTNPIAVCIPADKEHPFVAGMATTPIARGKLNVMHKKGENAPNGIVQDKDGNPSNDPNIIAEGGAMIPLGGDRIHGGHKGYRLAAIVDIFSALLSGANFGPFVPPVVPYLPVLEESEGKGAGHFFGAMRIDAFIDTQDFKSRMDEWISVFRNSKTIDGQEKVLIPGDPEREHEEINIKEGINILEPVQNSLIILANEFGLEFIKE